MIFYIDIDNVLIDTTQTIVEMYDEDFGFNKEYVKIPYEKVTSYGFDELELLSKSRAMNYFSTPRFFNHIHIIPGAMDAIEYLVDNGHEIVFISLGTDGNLIGKKKLIDELEECYGVPMRFIGLDSFKYKDKSAIDMFGGVLIDDELRNLSNSTASFTICFGDYSWNSSWDGYRMSNWEEIKDFLFTHERSILCHD